jgi:ribonuclease HII
MTRNKIPLVLPDFPDLTFESSLWKTGCLVVSGLDEAGRGAWAGPVAAGAVVLPPQPRIADLLMGVNDSKKLTPGERERLAEVIRDHCQCWGVGMASSEEIDKQGILPATRLAMKRALEQLGVSPQHLLLDFIRIPDVNIRQTALVKGDARSLSIAAASILAKTSRDAWMAKVDKEYPAYGFVRHKGYGTSAHQLALQENGPSPIHRMSFRPMRVDLVLNLFE